MTTAGIVMLAWGALPLAPDIDTALSRTLDRIFILLGTVLVIVGINQ